MPSALETLVKILKLEQNTGCQDRAVITGLASFAADWSSNAHMQAKKPEHHALVDELVTLMMAYPMIADTDERHAAIKHMLGRITGRVPPANSPPVDAPLFPDAAAPPTAQFAAPPALQHTPPPDNPPKRETFQSRPDRPSRAPRSEQPPREQAHRELLPDNVPDRVNDVDQVAEPVISLSDKIAPPRPNVPDRPFMHSPEALDDQPIVPESAYQITLDDLILEPIFAPAPEPFALTPPRAKPTPPRRHRDTRDLDEKLNVLRAIKHPVSELHGIGPKIAEKLATLDISTIEQLLYTFPRRYDDYTTMRPLNRLRPGELVSAMGMVRNAAMLKGKRNIEVYSVTIEDGAGTLTASFFNQPYLRGKLERGMQVVFSGKTDLYLGRLCMNNPHWEYVEQDALNTRAIVPVYPLTASLTPTNMRKATDAALNTWGEQLPDPIPASVLDRTGLAELSWAIRQMHRPDSVDTLELARQRLVFDDLMILQLGVLQTRRTWQSVPADPLPVGDQWLDSFASALPYALTGAQQRAIEAIRQDVGRPIPMNRLLQGDVGSGKTVVAAAALVMAVINGHQGALMAPTGILAEQHSRGLKKLFNAMPGGETIRVELLTSATPAAERAMILQGLADGSVQIVIGTHALIQGDVTFARLGIAIIDEQHRFGVDQRGQLRGKGVNPHVLVMTATPIPRTLALTMYADLDLTVLDEMPPGRTPIDTRVIYPKERERAYGFIRAQLEKGRQAFLVYPLVEASESESLSDVRSAVEEYERLQKEVFPEFKLGLLHGRLSPAEKDRVMGAFSAGDYHALVSTSVVEVGIDVPNASVILIESAGRFGLAQLHQFRGRVGRGQHPSFCLLIAEAEDESPDNINEPNNPRLRAMQDTSDGFKLAEIDWKLRGAGELLGTRQSGSADRLAEYMTPHMVEMAQQEARALYEEDAALEAAEHRLLRQKLTLVYGNDPSAEVS